MEEPRAASDWARAFAGWFQEAAPAFHLGRQSGEAASAWGWAQGAESEGSGPLCHTLQDYVHLSLEETLHGGSEPGTAAPQLGI